MNCLNCPNFWKTDIDETLCDGCGTQVQRPDEGEQEITSEG